MNYNATDTQNFFASATAHECEQFSHDLVAEWNEAWATRFEMTDRFAFDIANVPFYEKDVLINGLLGLAKAKREDPVPVIDYSGAIISDENPSNPLAPPYILGTNGNIYHIDGDFISYFPPIFVVRSFWIEHKIK